MLMFPRIYLLVAIAAIWFFESHTINQAGFGEATLVVSVTVDKYSRRHKTRRGNGLEDVRLANSVVKLQRHLQDDTTTNQKRNKKSIRRETSATL